MRSPSPLQLFAAVSIGLTLLAALPAMLVGGKDGDPITANNSTAADSPPAPSPTATSAPTRRRAADATPRVAGTSIPAGRYVAAVHHQPGAALPRLVSSGTAALFGDRAAIDKLNAAARGWRSDNTFTTRVDVRFDTDRRVWLNGLVLTEGASLGAWGEVQHLRWDRTGLTIEARRYELQTDSVWDVRMLLVWDARRTSLDLSGTISDPASEARIDLSAPLILVEPERLR